MSNPFAAFRSEVVVETAAARCDHGGLPAAGARVRAAAPRTRRSESARSRAGRGAGAPPRRQAPRQDPLGRRRGAHVRVFAVEPGGRGADVPRRGAAARPGRGDARRAHSRQARTGRLARPCREQSVPVRQRRHLGTRADGQARRHEQRAEPRRRADAAHRERRRADHPGRGRRRDAADGRAVRRRPHHRRGDRLEPRPGGARLHVLLRHARRGGDHRRGRRPLPRRIRAGRARHRPRRERARRLRGAGRVDQAVGAAPALPAHQARAGHARAAAAPQASGEPRPRLRHRPQHRRRGGRAARPVARHPRGAQPRPGPRGMERARFRHPGLRQALRLRGRLARRPRPAIGTAPDGPSRQGRLLGFGDQARPDRGPGRISRSSPAKSIPT